MANWQRHLEKSQRFRDQGLAEIELGDLLQGAAAHAVKAAAEQRGWEHNGHAFLHQVVDSLVLVTGDRSLSDGFQAANRLHVNFYEDTMELDRVIDRASRVSDFVDLVSVIVHNYGLQVLDWTR